MEITWYGGSCFRLKDRNTIALADPFLPDPRFQNLQIKTDLVTLSRRGPELRTLVPNDRKSVYFIEEPGEYEVGGIFVTAIVTSGSPNGAAPGLSNLISLFRIENVTVCHLGELEEPPSPELLEQITPLDVLLIPHGGKGRLTKREAAKLISACSPDIVIPMGYASDSPEDTDREIASLLEEAGLEKPEPLPALSVSRSSLLEDKTEVILLESKTKEKKPSAVKT